jgi:hypothetical protein
LIHEWGGPLENLIPIFIHIYEKNPTAQILLSPQHLKFFNVDSQPFLSEFLCLAKVLSPCQLARDYCSKVQLNSRYESSKFKEEIWEIKGEEFDSQSVTKAELSRFFFGPAAENSTQKIQPSPLPLWIWGLDAC